MKTFKDLDDQKPGMTTTHKKKLYFSNGYGISVVKGPFTYGGDEDLWECAVLHRGTICYSTHITNDVIGYCTEEKVTEIMKQIQEL